jgi:hypothetical protein
MLLMKIQNEVSVEITGVNKARMRDEQDMWHVSA